jgi:glycosyltransferase involved in cell wall biosynthesis
VVKNEIKKLKPNIVHSHNMTGYTIGAIKSGFPCLITPHGDWISEQLKNSQKKSIKTYLKVYIWKKIYKYIFNRGKAFSAISPYIEDLIKSYNPAANIFKINNPLSNDYYKKINRIRKKNRILWAGRICKLKRLDIAIEVFKSLREVYPYLIFEVAGQPDTKTEKEFNQLKKDAINSLGKKIVFHGQLSREDMIKCYDRSKIFLLTSEQEASPMVIAEAMVRGCVPVSFDLPGIRHLINDGVNGVMIKNRKPDLLKLKIIDMLNKPSLLNNMSINGINASYSYSSNKIIEQYISVFKQIG